MFINPSVLSSGMVYEYLALLSRARTQMPASVLEKERFEIPKVRGHLEGNKTLVSNFQQIVRVLRRPQEHLLKYILKQLAAPGEVARSGLLIIGTKVSASRVNDKVREYANEFVLCPVCGKPDTEIRKEGDFHMLVCTACGNKHTVKSKI